MKNFKKKYKELSDILNNEYIPKNSYITLQSQIDNLINESSYFNKIDDNFQNYLVSLFDNLIPNKQLFKEKYQLLKNNFYVEDFISISQIFNHLNLNNINNFKNCKQIFELLKKSIGQLHIIISYQKLNYYQCPIDLLKQKIIINDKNENEQLNKIENNYKEILKELFKEKSLTLNKQYQIIKNNILSLDNFGSIHIYSQYWNNREEYKKSVIWHQFQHFLYFLLRINFVNWRVGKTYSNKCLEFFNQKKLFNFDEKQRQKYFLNEEQFKPLAGTYIQQLKILFKNNCNNNQKNKFLTVFFQMCNIPFQLQKITIKQTIKYTELLNELFDIKDIKDFFFYNFNDSLSQKNSNLSKNRWKILKKYILKEFNKN